VDCNTDCMMMSICFPVQRPKSRSVTSCVSLSAMEDTNGDPRSLAAVSIPHLRTQTPYGFTTVSENPHSRRKESLLLGSNSFDDLKLFNRKISGEFSLNQWHTAWLQYSSCDRKTWLITPCSHCAVQAPHLRYYYRSPQFVHNNFEQIHSKLHFTL